jgi:PhnB protein
MSQVNVYLTFNGCCREAMSFYKSCLGGQLQFQTIGESPMANKMPETMKDLILHASLTKDKLILLGSDMAPEQGLIIGNAVSLVLNCESEEEINNRYNLLSEGGKKDHPLEITFWGATFGDLTDKYGNRWLLNYLKTPSN